MLEARPLADARAAVEHPNGPEVWDGLLAEFAAELRQAGRVEQVDNLSFSELDDAGVPWVPRFGGNRGRELSRASAVHLGGSRLVLHQTELPQYAQLVSRAPAI